MGDFFPGGPQIPAPPFEIPTPDIPPADFVSVGRQIGQGMKDAGAAGPQAPGFLDWIGQIVAKIIAALLNLIFDSLAFLIRLIFRGLQLGESGMDQLAAQIVSGVTGVPAGSVQFSNALDRGGRESYVQSLVVAIQQALATGQPAGGAGGLQPSSAGANEFLKFTTHMAIEGWLIGLVCDAVSVHEFEQVAQLKEALEQALGLNRLARRALAAPMKILVEDPYTWLLNQSYRPTLLSENVLVRQYLRGIVPRGDLDKFAGYLGHSSSNTEALINFYKGHLSPGDIETLRLHGQLDDATATRMLNAQGYDDATAASLQIALAAGRHDTWARQLVGEALVGLEKRFLTPTEFDQYLNNSGLPADEKGILTLFANLKYQFSRKRFTIAEGEQLVKKGLWSLDQFRQLATDLGYSPEDELSLELLTLVEIRDAADAAAKKKTAADARAAAAKAKAAAAQAKAAAAAAAAEAKGISISRFETLVEDHLKTMDQYKLFLHAKGIAPDNVDALSEVLQTKLDQAAALAAAHPGLAAGAKAKHLDLAQLEAAALAGVLTVTDFQTKLEGIGFSPDDITLLTGVLNDRIHAAQVKATAKAELAARAKSKNVDLAQEQRGVRLGILTIDQYRAFLAQLGFSAESADLLVGEMDAQLKSDAAARQTKASVQAGLKAKGLSLTQLEQAVRAGVNTIADYRAALAKAGYDTAAQDSLVSLLDLRMEQDQATLAAKGHATALLDKEGLSLAEIERAVKLGVIPIAVYSDALKRAGVSDPDAQVLVLSLSAASKTTKAQQGTKASVAKQLSQAGLSLANIESNILAGRFTVEQLGAVLAGAGISSDDQAAVSKLISDEVANQQHLAQLEGKANAAAGQKGLSLSEEQAAVKANVKTIEDYRQFLVNLNFAPADVETLAATLETKLKEPKAPTPPPAVP